MSIESHPPAPGRRMSADELADFEEVFDSLDEDGDRRITFAEFSQLLDDLGADMGHEEIHAGFRRIDHDKDGAISFDELIDWWKKR